ncbi:DUF4350 domain-containing protein [Chitinophaga tropicalis]|uniref:DUF4350 domain-containing protein n=1 Tax=Chitinophaga tropicalis TaxID=2683588 RepID=A0A7K1U9F6_9BACT|nr:DUF4350 domain-containing protein [Chitinophaga tropicalis]MVT10920.1 hypothetical protein [Chitinophaga tropicalis]
MKSKTIIILFSVLGLVVILLLVLSSRTQSEDKQEDIDLTQQSFSYKDKKPGGCYVAYQALPHIFTYYAVKPHIVTKSFTRTYSKDDVLSSAGGNLYILVTDKLYTSKEDVQHMLTYVTDGNELFIAANEPDSLLLERLGLKLAVRTSWPLVDSSVQHFVNPNLAPDTVYSRIGIFAGRYFSGMDTSRTVILGTNANHQPNFIKIHHGKGDIFLSLNPSALTNYFLLHRNNIMSMERQLGYTSYYAENVYWDEYYKYLRSRDSSDFSEWEVLMRFPAMRWALWLIVVLLLIYVLFESKRRQRIIPEKPLLTNNSLEFVEAMGQLYYQQHDNANLARKIIQQWMEFIRSRYYLGTHQIDDNFADALSRKAVMPLQHVKDILQEVEMIQRADRVSDDSLKRFYKNIQAFYLNSK